MLLAKRPEINISKIYRQYNKVVYRAAYAYLNFHAWDGLPPEINNCNV